MSKSKLYEPMKIGSLEIKNRVMMAPISTGYESIDGTINEVSHNFWVARAKGGVGIIVVDAVTVDKDVPYQTPGTISLGDDSTIASFKAFTDECHKYNTKVFPQLAYMGAESCNLMVKGIPAVGPSAYVNQFGIPCREMRLDEIPGIIKKYGEAALRAKKSGCDGIQLHCAHAYMCLGAFLSPLRNKRTDRYGGSLDNRARLTFEVIAEMRKMVGPDFPIMMRISPDEHSPGGLTLHDWLYLIPKMEAAGIDAFEISGGNPYEAFDGVIPCHYAYHGVNIENAKAIKAMTKKPIYVVGKITDPKFAEYVVEQGYADGVTFGRPLLADAEVVNKAIDGKYEDICPCANCGGPCITRSREDRVMHCVINPALGREVEWAIKPLEGKPKNVLVVGAGPAGLSAARVAALRGHKVTIIEKQQKVGGQLALASVPPFKQEVTTWVIWLLTQCEKLGVEFIYNTEATVDLIKSKKPDVVFVATGSDPVVLKNLPGFDTLEKVVTTHDVLSCRTPILRGKVAMLGGGLTACETANHIVTSSARGDIDLTIIEMQPSIVAGLSPTNRKPLLKSLNNANVKVMTSTQVMEFNGKDIIVSHNGKKEILEGFDHIIWGIGVRPNTTLLEELKKTDLNVIVIGDSQKIGDGRSAVETGYWEANNI